MTVDYTRLSRINWNFPQAGTTPGSIHKFHWFPGNFIPQIPAALIEILSSQGDIVLDPFGGSGTTILEAARLGRRGVYSDSVSACVFLTNAKLAASTRGLSAETKDRILKAITFDHTSVSDAFGSNGEGSNQALALWYAPRTLAQLRYIWSTIEREDNPQRLILALAFSDLLFACASTEGSHTKTGKIRRHHWGWVADNVIPKKLIEHNAIAGFRRRMLELVQPIYPPLHEPEIFQADARALPLVDSSVDLVVTSPPYISVIEYVRANRLLYLWMGWAFDEERANEIGARYKRQRGSSREQYLADMSDCWSELYRVLRPGGRLALVIGESRAFPGTFERALENLGQLMPIMWGPKERTPTRRRVSDREAQSSREVIVVAEKR